MSGNFHINIWTDVDDGHETCHFSLSGSESINQHATCDSFQINIWIIASWADVKDEITVLRDGKEWGEPSLKFDVNQMIIRGREKWISKLKPRLMDFKEISKQHSSYLMCLIIITENRTSDRGEPVFWFQFWYTRRIFVSERSDLHDNYMGHATVFPHHMPHLISQTSVTKRTPLMDWFPLSIYILDSISFQNWIINRDFWKGRNWHREGREMTGGTDEMS